MGAKKMSYIISDPFIAEEYYLIVGEPFLLEDEDFEDEEEEV